MASNPYRPFTCNDCGDSLSAREVANELPIHVHGTAGSRTRRVLRYCGECHAQNEWKRHEEMRASALRVAGEAARSMVEHGLAANLDEALKMLGQ